MTVKQYSFTLYNAGLLLLAASLPLWMLLMSMSQIILLFAWLAGGGLKEKFIKAFGNPVVLVLTGVFFIHVAGLIYTSDFNNAFRDLRIKLPLLLLPVVISTMPPLSRIQFNNVLKVLIYATLISTLCSLAVFLGITTKHVENIRDISIFISHIRLALIICVAIVSIIYLLNREQNQKIKIIYILIIIWFIVFLALLQSLTGLTILSILFFVYCFSLLRRSKSSMVRQLMTVFMLVFLSATGLLYRYLFVDSVKKINVDPKMLKQSTVLGHPYTHLPERQDHENGNLVWVNVCETELDSAWNTHSDLPYYGKDFKGQDIKYTLIRYLTSKNSTKDAAGINQLTIADIKAIEQGIPNINYLHKSDLSTRLQQLAWEYRNYYFSGNPSGHSAMQRLEFWKTALYIIRKNPIIGVGTGDVQKAFNTAYIELKSQLLPAYRFHSHNEYLTMTVAFGILGGLYFLFFLAFPFIYMKKKSDFLYVSFLLILLLSMLTEDTPETQAGVTFMAFFNSLFLFHNEDKAAKT